MMACHLAGAKPLSAPVMETNVSETSIEIFTFSFKKMHLKMSSGKWRPICLPKCVNEAISTYNVIIKWQAMHAAIAWKCTQFGCIKSMAD